MRAGVRAAMVALAAHLIFVVRILHQVITVRAAGDDSGPDCPFRDAAPLSAAHAYGGRSWRMAGITPVESNCS